MIKEEHKLVLQKLAQRALRDKPIENNIEGLLARVNNRTLTVAGWIVELVESDGKKYISAGEPESGYVYEYTLAVRYERRDNKAPDKNVFPSLCRTIYTASAQPALGRWTLITVDGKEYVPPNDNAIPLSDDFVGYADFNLPDDFEKHFDHLYGLDSHIARIKSAMVAGMQSGWMHRFHCALIGPPGCGKSDICGTIKKVLGEEAVLEFDATATTAAGAIKELAEREILPRVLLVEEIEKADEKALAFLLAILDLRSEIRKVTARATIQRDTKLFAICTVNNWELFFKLNAGALASRFAHKIWFQRPDRAQLEKILVREITKIQGDYDWIAPTLDYCERKDITDPRQVTALCISGRDQWVVNDEYVKILEETGPTVPENEIWS